MRVMIILAGILNTLGAILNCFGIIFTIAPLVIAGAVLVFIAFGLALAALVSLIKW